MSLTGLRRQRESGSCRSPQSKVAEWRTVAEEAARRVLEGRGRSEERSEEQEERVHGGRLGLE